MSRGAKLKGGVHHCAMTRGAWAEGGVTHQARESLGISWWGWTWWVTGQPAGNRGTKLNLGGPQHP